MITLSGEKRSYKVQNESLNGLNVVVNLVASANNVDIADTQYNTGTGFDAANVNIEVTLKRDGRITTLISSNLGILGHYFTITGGANSWYKGYATVKKGAAVKQEMIRSLFIPFMGTLNLRGTDELMINVSNGNDIFNTGVDRTLSSILVTHNQSIGYEKGIYKFHAHTLQANMSNESVNLGDNVQRVALISFEKAATKRIFKTASLSSDRLDFTKTNAELQLGHEQFFGYNFSDSLARVTQGEDIVKIFPSSLLVHDFHEIDQAKINVSLDSANVLASQNFICWTSFETSIAQLVKVAEMSKKHQAEYIEKTPQTVAS